MERIYIYSSLVLMTVAVYHGFSEGYIWLPVILTPIALVVAAKLYAHTQGKQLSQWQKELPVLKLMAYVLRDKQLCQQQNSQSLFAVLFFGSFFLCADITMVLFLSDIHYSILFAGCVSFAVLYSALMVNYRSAN